MKKNKKQKGFTLIELLVVIAIIAILAVVVVLTLNPAQLLAQARDSNRISDFATLKSALTLYATDVSTSTPMYGSGADTLFTANPTATATISLYTTTSTSAVTPQTTWGFSTSTGGYASLATNTSRSVSGSGWIPVNLSAISAGAPISAWPVDPVNSGEYMYIYGASTTVFKLDAHMESSKYITNGPNDVESTDGGSNPGSYEAGTNLSL